MDGERIRFNNLNQRMSNTNIGMCDTYRRIVPRTYVWVTQTSVNVTYSREYVTHTSVCAAKSSEYVTLTGVHVIETPVWLTVT